MPGRGGHPDGSLTHSTTTIPNHHKQQTEGGASLSFWKAKQTGSRLGEDKNIITKRTTDGGREERLRACRWRMRSLALKGRGEVPEKEKWLFFYEAVAVDPSKVAKRGETGRRRPFLCYFALFPSKSDKILSSNPF